MKADKVRVRFAPSPTGWLHIGGARTALFNWMFARGRGGAFVLRIEDTDEARSTKEAVEQIYRSLRWLGLDWDEGPDAGGGCGPYIQTERIDFYRRCAFELLDKNLAYKCYCTQQELEEKRRRAMTEKKPPKYDGSCSRLPEEKKKTLEKSGVPFVLRFRAPADGETVFCDMIRGEVKFKNSLLDDFVILKSGGYPAFNFANVIDDSMMKISHVIRGDEHLSNTPRQILVYKALGFELPEFAHLPMILGTDGAKLSKRHGAVAVEWFREEGFLPEALLNYLALLGWGTSDSQQVFESTEEMIEKFSLERVSRNPAVFDIKKLEWMNGHYIRRLDPGRLVELCVPYLREEGCLGDNPGRDYIEKVVLLERERLKKLKEIAGLTRFFFSGDVSIEQEAKRKILGGDEIPALLSDYLNVLENAGSFDVMELERVTRDYMARKNIKGKHLMQPVRVAVTGRKDSPGLFEVMNLLGREKTTARIKKAVEMLKKSR